MPALGRLLALARGVRNTLGTVRPAFGNIAARHSACRRIMIGWRFGALSLAAADWAIWAWSDFYTARTARQTVVYPQMIVEFGI